MAEGLSALWSARAVAVIGASDRPGSLGRLPVQFLLRYGFGGPVYPVRPDGAPVAGLASYASVTDCPGPVDLAMLMVSADRVAAAVDDCAAAGVGVAIVCASGFAETGPEGAALQAEIAAKARAAGVRLVGPNCIGSIGVGHRQVTSFSPLFAGEHTELVDGSLGFVSQSGALGYGAVSLAFERGLGLGWAVNTGNEADVGALEVMETLAEEPACQGILAYLETLDDAERLRRVASSGVPIAVLKAGRSEAGQRAAESHTGALAAGDRVVDAALRQLGVVRVSDVDELLDVGDAFAQPLRPAGPRVAVVTTSGGSGILAADACETHGLTLAQFSAKTQSLLDDVVPAYGATANPVDVTATVMSNAELFGRTLDAISDDDGVDMVVACFCVLTGQDVDDVVASLGRTAERSRKPVLAARTGAAHLAPGAAERLREAGVPTYPTPARAVRAAAALHQVTTHRPSPLLLRVPRLDAQREVGHAAEVGESGLKALLADAGLPVPTGVLVRDTAAAVRAVDNVGGVAVMKAVVPGLTHKTEAGGVALGIDPANAAATYERLAALGGEVLVEEMVPTGVDVLVGITPSALGQVLAVGLGGVLTEVLDDVALRLLPIEAADVEEMLDETRLATLLAGVRGASPADRDALLAAVVAVADLVAGWPPGFELDLNPVRVLPAGQGVRILDAAYIAPGA